MADPVALWGAITGTVAVAFVARRELILNRKRLGLEHGLWYLVREDRPPDLTEAWLTMQVWNDGGQPLTVERVGIKYVPIWIRGEVLVVTAAEGLAEIELQGAQVELRPGGPSRRFFAPLRGLMQAGVDVLHEPVVAWVKTSEGKEWLGKDHPVVPRRVPEPFREAVERAQSELDVRREAAPAYVSLPNQGPPAEGGVIYG